MGRHRQHNRHLPPRVFLRHGAYYHVVHGVWTRLSDRLDLALARWAEIEGPPSRGSTVGAAIDRYQLEALPRLAERTRQDYVLSLGRLRTVFGEVELTDVRPMHVAQYLDRRSAKVSANRDVAVLSSVFAMAMRWGWCDANPCRGVRRNPERARERYLSDTELQALRDAADAQWQCIIDLAYLTALRRGDLMALRLGDIEPDGLAVTHRKTGARRLYTMTAELKLVLDRIRRLRRRVGTLLLFAARNGQPYSAGGWESAWRRLRTRAGITDAHFHDLRAKALTDAKRVGGLDYAQALGGHERRDTTEGYVRARETVPVRPLR
jgi:integrase